MILHQKNLNFIIILISILDRNVKNISLLLHLHNRSSNFSQLTVQLKLYFISLVENKLLCEYYYTLFMLFLYDNSLLTISDKINEVLNFRMLENFDKKFIHNKRQFYKQKIVHIIKAILYNNYDEYYLTNNQLVDLQSLWDFINKYPEIVNNKYICEKIKNLILIYVKRFYRYKDEVSYYINKYNKISLLIDNRIYSIKYDSIQILITNDLNQEININNDVIQNDKNSIIYDKCKITLNIEYTNNIYQENDLMELPRVIITFNDINNRIYPEIRYKNKQNE